MSGSYFSCRRFYWRVGVFDILETLSYNPAFMSPCDFSLIGVRRMCLWKSSTAYSQRIARPPLWFLTSGGKISPSQANASQRRQAPSHVNQSYFAVMTESLDEDVKWPAHSSWCVTFTRAFSQRKICSQSHSFLPQNSRDAANHTNWTLDRWWSLQFLFLNLALSSSTFGYITRINLTAKVDQTRLYDRLR